MNIDSDLKHASPRQSVGGCISGRGSSWIVKYENVLSVDRRRSIDLLDNVQDNKSINVYDRGGLRSSLVHFILFSFFYFKYVNTSDISVRASEWVLWTIFNCGVFSHIYLFSFVLLFRFIRRFLSPSDRFRRRYVCVCVWMDGHAPARIYEFAMKFRQEIDLCNHAKNFVIARYAGAVVKMHQRCRPACEE